MSQVELASYLGPSQSWLSKVEAGQLIPDAAEFLKAKRLAKRFRRTAKNEVSQGGKDGKTHR